MDFLTNINLPSLLIPSIIGYILGVLKEQKHVKNEVKCLKKALKTELETISAIYQERNVKDEPPSNSNEINVMSLQSDYTTVYSHNADKIGMMDEQTAKIVVIAYTRIAALMDTLRVYSQDWKNSHNFFLHEQEETLKAINKAIEQLSK